MSLALCPSIWQFLRFAFHAKDPGMPQLQNYRYTFRKQIECGVKLAYNVWEKVFMSLNFAIFTGQSMFLITMWNIINYNKFKLRYISYSNDFVQLVNVHVVGLYTARNTAIRVLCYCCCLDIHGRRLINWANWAKNYTIKIIIYWLNKQVTFSMVFVWFSLHACVRKCAKCGIRSGIPWLLWLPTMTTAWLLRKFVFSIF